MTKHITVLKKESVDLLKIKPNGTYVDLTLGGGGHSLNIIENLKEGTLIVFDIDKKAIDGFCALLKETKFKEVEGKSTNIKEFGQEKKKVYVVNSNFENIEEIINSIGFTKVDGILADLGWSIDQLDAIEGLSYEKEEDNLDMRFDSSLNITAADFLNALGKKELKNMFERYADFFGVQNNTLVEELVKHRRKNKFTKVSELNEFIIYLSNNYIFKKSNRNQLKARVYQSLRIAVNNEYNNLKNMLANALKIMDKDSRIGIITFHSGEEKIVEGFLGELVSTKKAAWVSDSKNKLFVQPALNELKENISSRSSKLWAVELV